MDVIFLTGAKMPIPDFETHILVSELSKLGISSKISAWNANEKWSDAKLVVIRTTWDYHENLSGFLSQLNFISSQTKLINSVNIINWNIHKKYLQELNDFGVQIVPTVFFDKGNSITQKDLIETGFDMIVIKPAISLGAIGALKTSVNETKAISHANNLLLNNDILIQPFVNDILNGEVSMLFFDNKFSHAVLKIPKYGEYRVQDTYGGSVIPYSANNQELIIAQKAISLAPDNLSYARVDLVNYNDAPHLMELELIEPNIFTRYSNVCIQNFISMIKKYI